ncbi:MAG: hypothetical protein JXQ29_07680, partial [Planctomycetes bacterium]|nr:hypothetical protein [Planctomycetota bacterium]
PIRRPARTHVHVQVQVHEALRSPPTGSRPARMGRAGAAAAADVMTMPTATPMPNPMPAL